MTVKSVAAEPKGVTLTLGDKLDILKSKRAFPLVFPLVMLLLITALFSALTGGQFLSRTVMLGIFNQSLIVGTMAIGVSFIYSIGEIDFSVGASMGLAAAIGALVYSATGNIVLMILVQMVVAIGLMLFNCTLGVTFHLMSATVAIVAMSLYTAITQWIIGPEPISVDYDACKVLEDGYRYVAFLLYFLVCLLVYHGTSVGRKLRFIGGNETCANQSGIRSSRSRYWAFVMAGIGVGIAATLTTIRTASVAIGVGGSMGMDVMLATVLGGMSIFGGARSNAYAGLIGALTVTALNKGLLMMNVPSTLIQGVRGVIFLLLVFANSQRPDTLPSRQQM